MNTHHGGRDKRRRKWPWEGGPHIMEEEIRGEESSGEGETSQYHHHLNHHNHT